MDAEHSRLRGIKSPRCSSWKSSIMIEPSGHCQFSLHRKRTACCNPALTTDNATQSPLRTPIPFPVWTRASSRGEDATIYSTLDANRSYWQFSIAKGDRHNPAFVPHYGFFQFIHISFGFKNAPGRFRPAIDVILSTVLRQIALVYLNDIEILSKIA